MLEFINNHLIFSIIILLNIIGSLISLFLYASDKRKAINNSWRIKEKTLLLSTLLFGAVGSFIGVFILRHKTRHWYFVLTAIVSLIIQALLLYFTFNLSL